MGLKNQIDNNLFSFLGADQDHLLSLKTFAETTLKNSFGGIIIYDNNFKIIFWNTEIEKLVGISQSKAVGENLLQVMPFLNTPVNLVFFHQVGQGKEVCIPEIIIDIPAINKHGYIAANISPVENAKGEPIGGIINFNNFTSITEAEKINIKTIKYFSDIERFANQKLKLLLSEFRFVTDFIPDIVWSSDPFGEVDYFNKRWYDYTGLNRDSSLKSGWASVLHPIDLQQTLDQWNNSVRTGNPYQVEYRLRKYDGTFRWFLGRGFPLSSDSGEITKWYGTCTDIHDQKISREDLGIALDEMNKKNTELKRINEFLDTFVHAAAHDLKSPINQMILILELFNKVANESKKEKLLFELGNAVKRLDQTTKSLVELIKVQYNDQVEVKDIDVGALIKAVKSELSKLIEESEATITMTLADGESIYYVEPFLTCIIRNLLSNALKYRSEERVPIIHIGTLKQDNTFVLTISDNGMGMDLEKIKDKLFKPFSRFTRKGEGTGIGLHLIKTIVEKNGGGIEIQSEPELGTTFTLHLKEYKKNA